jgi:hypothetical protein
MTDAQILPDPLTPPGCNLKSMPSMLLDVQRLCDSGIASHENAEVFRTAMLLWCKSWHQIPAASLDDKDSELAGLAGFGRGSLDKWMAIRADVLRSFVKCSDGRLYHPVVAEKALEQWINNLMRKVSGAKGNGAQGKAGANASEAHMEALGDAAYRLRRLNPLSDTFKKDAVKVALALFDESPLRPDPDAARLDRERIASGMVAHGERTASRSASDIETQRVPTGSRSADAPRTQDKGNRNISPQPPLEGGVRDALFDKIFAAYPETGRASTDQLKALKALPAIVEEIGADALLGCVAKLAASDYARQDGGKKVSSLHRWLTGGKWRNWLTTEAAQASAPTWAGPAEIREAMIAYVADARGGRAKAEEWAASWLDSVTTWSEVPKAIVCRSGTVLKRLQEAVGAMLRTEYGVQLRLAVASEVAA